MPRNDSQINTGNQINTGDAEKDVGDEEVYLGLDGGQVFRWAALLAPLSRTERRTALDDLRGDGIGTRYDLLSRARNKWQKLGWAQCLYDEGADFGKREEAAFMEQLHGADRIARENAAFGVWVLHASEATWERALRINLSGLAHEVRRLAVATQDRMIQRVAIDLAQATAPGALIATARQLPWAAHLLRQETLLRAPDGPDRLTDALRQALARLDQEGAATADLFHAWEFSTALARSLPYFPGLAEALAADRALRRNGGFALATILGRADAEAGQRWFGRAAHQMGLRGKDAAQEIIHGTSARPGAVFGRRVATMLLRHGTREHAAEVARRALEDRQVFVRHSAVSSLRESLGSLLWEGNETDLPRIKGTALPRIEGLAPALSDLTTALEEVLRRGERARGASKPVDLLHPALHLLVLLSPERGWQASNRIASSLDGEPEMRGYGLFWLGALRREERQPPGADALIQGLLERLHSHREYAVHVAQVLAAPALRRRGETGRANLGTQKQYRDPLWRTDWL